MTSPILLGKKLRPLTPEEEDAFSGPDWVQANPSRIQKMLARTLARPSGGWYVLGPSRAISSKPVKFTVLGTELVAWRDDDQIHVAPNACPHMGAELACGHVRDGRIVCPWHGLALGQERHGRWQPLLSYDDGVLTWVRMAGEGEATTEAPILAPRPSVYLDAVVQMEVACEPRDIIANRLDPWHGAHFHPYSFSRLKVIDADPDDVLTVRVAYKLGWRFCIEVDATFHCPEPRTIVMTIIDGEGAGSVVETHATPIAPGRSMLTEVTLATSDREGFSRALPLTRLIRPLMEWAAHKLWIDDAAYAERTYELREKNIRY